MAAKRHVTVIANTHLSKASGGSANSRVIGSVAFVNHARAAFIVTEDPDDRTRRLFLPSKTNLGKPRDGLAYRIADFAFPDPDDGSVIWAPYVQWEDAPVTISADQAMVALAGGPEGKSAIEEAKQFLVENAWRWGGPGEGCQDGSRRSHDFNCHAAPGQGCRRRQSKA